MADKLQPTIISSTMKLGLYETAIMVYDNRVIRRHGSVVTLIDIIDGYI